MLAGVFCCKTGCPLKSLFDKEPLMGDPLPALEYLKGVALIYKQYPLCSLELSGAMCTAGCFNRNN